MPVAVAAQTDVATFPEVGDLQCTFQDRAAGDASSLFSGITSYTQFAPAGSTCLNSLLMAPDTDVKAGMLKPSG